MRTVRCMIISLLLFMTLFAGCTKKDELSIRICGYSDSIPESSHKLEYQEWSEEAFVDSKAEKNISLSVGNIEVAGEYVETEIRFSEFYKTHKYKDENNRFFSVTDDGTLCAYFFGSRSSEDDHERTYTESECVDIARAFLSDITDVSEYTVTTAFDEDRSMYTVSFVKYADGFRCSDRADIRIEETGHIYSFSSTMLGRMSSDATTNFDKEAIRSQIISKLDSEYSEAKQAYDNVSYENFDYELTIDDDGKYALICSIDVRCIRSYDGYDSIVSERIRLFIQ